MAYDDTLEFAKRYSTIWKPMPFFHLRPTASNATIVCTVALPNIAMRGRTKGNHQFINEHYNSLLNLHPNMNDDLILAELRALGFNERGHSNQQELEKIVQAMFINLLYSDKNLFLFLGDEYSNVHFIASELVYPIVGIRKMIPDVVAECDKYILLIEIKKGKDINSGDEINQLKNYADTYFGNDNAERTYELLRNYPNHQISENKEVRMIYLLHEGDSTPKCDSGDVRIIRYKVMDDELLIHQ